MKKTISLIFLLSSFIIFSGCPYESEVPIDAPSLYINTGLIGTWEARNNPDESFKVTKHDEFSYNIEKINKKSTEDNVQKYIGHLSSVGNVTFLNVCEDKPGDRKYSLYKIAIPNDGFVNLTEVTENIKEHFKKSA